MIKNCLLVLCTAITLAVIWPVGAVLTILVGLCSYDDYRTAAAQKKRTGTATAAREAAELDFPVESGGGKEIVQLSYRAT